MTEPDDVMERARRMMALAESVDGASPGAAGLAYQAAELATKVLLVAVDGADPWRHDLRNRRVSELLGVAVDDLAFIFRVRLLDFYAAATTESDRENWRGPHEAPSVDDCRRAVSIARRTVDAAASAFRELKLRDR